MRNNGKKFLDDDFVVEKRRGDGDGEVFDYEDFLKKVSDKTKKVSVSPKKIMFLMDDSREAKSAQGSFLSSTTATVKTDKKFFANPGKYTPSKEIRTPGKREMQRLSYNSSFLENILYPLLLINGYNDYYVLTERAIEQLPGGREGIAGSETRMRNIAECLSIQKEYLTLLYREDGNERKVFFIFKTDIPMIRQDNIPKIVERQKQKAPLQFERLRYTHDITEVGFSFENREGPVRPGIVFRTSDTGVASFSVHRAYFSADGEDVHEKDGVSVIKRWKSQIVNGRREKTSPFDEAMFDEYIQEWADSKDPMLPEIDALSMSMKRAERAFIEKGWKKTPEEDRLSYFLKVPEVYDTQVAKATNFLRKAEMGDRAFFAMCPND